MFNQSDANVSEYLRREASQEQAKARHGCRAHFYLVKNFLLWVLSTRQQVPSEHGRSDRTEGAFRDAIF